MLNFQKPHFQADSFPLYGMIIVLVYRSSPVNRSSIRRCLVCVQRVISHWLNSYQTKTVPGWPIVSLKCIGMRPIIPRKLKDARIYQQLIQWIQWGSDTIQGAHTPVNNVADLFLHAQHKTARHAHVMGPMRAQCRSHTIYV